MRITTLSFILMIVLSMSAVAQREVQTPEQAVQGEGQLVFTYDGGSVSLETSLLDMVYECNRAAGTVLAVNGVDHFRIFGFDFVSAEAYALQGPRAFNTATQRAQTRAMGSATEFLFGVASWTTRVLADNESSTEAASSVGAPNASDRERLSSLSITTTSTFRQVFETQSSGFLRGGAASGTKFVSLGDNYGYCVIVRYDVPLDQSSNPGEPNSPVSAASAPAGQQDAQEQHTPDEESGFRPLPRGSAGDF